MKRLQDYVQKRIDNAKCREERREAIHAKMDVQSVAKILQVYFFLKGYDKAPEWSPPEFSTEARIDVKHAEYGHVSIKPELPAGGCKWT